MIKFYKIDGKHACVQLSENVEWADIKVSVYKVVIAFLFIFLLVFLV